METYERAFLPRRRGVYAVAILLVIALGLGSRKFGAHLPTWIAAYAGDTLWALCVYLVAGMLRPAAAIRHLAVVSLLFAYLIEFSQLYHAPWIDAVRQIRLAQLVLGSGFLWSDLACYTVGIGMGVLAEWLVRRNQHD